jgi:hypothetical protein
MLWVPATTVMPAARDDRATREERLAELMEEFRARHSQSDEDLEATATLARTARQLAELGRLKGKEAIARADLVSRKPRNYQK